MTPTSCPTAHRRESIHRVQRWLLQHNLPRLQMGLIQRLKASDPAHWLQGALRKTWLPAVAMAFFFSLAGLALQSFAPEAKSIGEVVERFAE